MELTRQIPDRSFSAPLWHSLASFALGAILFALVVWHRDESGVLALLVPVLLIGFGVIVLCGRVRISADSIVVREAFRSRAFSRSTVIGVRRDAPAIVSIKIADIGWVRLPYMGTEANALLVNLKYWLGQGAQI